MFEDVLNESMLLESGKVFIGKCVSGIGAKIVDDSRTITIPVSIQEGKAEIVSVTVPPSFTPGVAFDVGFVIKNVSNFADDLFIRFTDTDTGRIIAEATLRLSGGATEDWGINITLVQTTDFHGLVEVGHG